MLPQFELVIKCHSELFTWFTGVTEVDPTPTVVFVNFVKPCHVENRWFLSSTNSASTGSSPSRHWFPSHSFQFSMQRSWDPSMQSGTFFRRTRQKAYCSFWLSFSFQWLYVLVQLFIWSLLWHLPLRDEHRSITTPDMF